jgi:hypothetical protein
VKGGVEADDEKEETDNQRLDSLMAYMYIYEIPAKNPM